MQRGMAFVKGRILAATSLPEELFYPFKKDIFKLMLRIYSIVTRLFHVKCNLSCDLPILPTKLCNQRKILGQKMLMRRRGEAYLFPIVVSPPFRDRRGDGRRLIKKRARQVNGGLSWAIQVRRSARRLRLPGPKQRRP